MQGITIVCNFSELGFEEQEENEDEEAMEQSFEGFYYYHYCYYCELQGCVSPSVYLILGINVHNPQ